MSKLKIDRPNWPKLLGIPISLLSEESKNAIKTFESWFDLDIEPINEMFRNGVEVIGSFDVGHGCFIPEAEAIQPHKETHKALLINIDPIEKETAEDVLRDIVKYQVNLRGSDLEKRAKAVLGESERIPMNKYSIKAILDECMDLNLSAQGAFDVALEFIEYEDEGVVELLDMFVGIYLVVNGLKEYMEMK